jgi:hypothetical protein
MKTVLVSLALVFASQQTAAQEFERRLIPITVKQAQGLFGTLWTTNLFGFNDEDGVLVRGLAYFGPTLAPSPGPWNPTPFYTEEYETPGTILYVPREHAAKVHIDASVVQESLAGKDELNIPVVPESEFSDAPSYFLGIMDNKDERTHLRIYSLDLEKTRATVRVQIMARDALRRWDVRYETTLDLDVVQRLSLWPEKLPVRPLSAQIALDPLLEATGYEGPYIVIVKPETDGLRTWALISETDNESQRIQVVVPQ